MSSCLGTYFRLSCPGQTISFALPGRFGQCCTLLRCLEFELPMKRRVPDSVYVAHPSEPNRDGRPCTSSARVLSIAPRVSLLPLSATSAGGSSDGNDPGQPPDSVKARRVIAPRSAPYFPQSYPGAASVRIALRVAGLPTPTGPDPSRHELIASDRRHTECDS